MSEATGASSADAILSDRHRHMLEVESAITPEVIEARGYRTIEKKVDLKNLGFADRQCNPPGLLIPIYSPTGEVANYQYRADMPRIGRDDKPVKYETPSGTRMVLDVHRFAREMLGDPCVPLFITEGVRKGDALVSRGLCTVTLLGVWNWRGTNERGGKAALPEWEYVALNDDREVYIVFDSDIVLKPEVYSGMVRLKAFLEGR
ncbi:MAG: DUF3854 domain-containing protein [Actinomycetota bacterium]|nr:DUF3854 domain-containing protein [Actinomycetota bacterium]